MSANTDDGGPNFLTATFAEALRGEPALGLDFDAIEQGGHRRAMRRRFIVVVGSAVAVTTLTVGIAAGAPRWDGSTVPASVPAVPGCETVLRTTDPAMLSWMYDGELPSQTQSEEPVDSIQAATGGPGPEEYQAPTWFTPEKAALMRATLDAALPTGLAVQAVGDGGTLPFSERPDGIAVLGTTGAQLSIQTQLWDRGAPPCTETVALRYTAPDGTIADVMTDGRPGNPGYGTYLVADAFHPDGTWVNATLNWNTLDDAAPVRGNLPMTPQQLAQLVANPAFAVS